MAAAVVFTMVAVVVTDGFTAEGVECVALPRPVTWLAPACVEAPAWGTIKIEAPKTDATNIATSRPIATVPTVRFPA